MHFRIQTANQEVATFSQPWRLGDKNRAFSKSNAGDFHRGEKKVAKVFTVAPAARLPSRGGNGMILGAVPGSAGVDFLGVHRGCAVQFSKL